MFLIRQLYYNTRYYFSKMLVTFPGQELTRNTNLHTAQKSIFKTSLFVQILKKVPILFDVNLWTQSK